MLHLFHTTMPVFLSSRKREQFASRMPSLDRRYYTDMKCKRIAGYRKREKSAVRKNAYLISSALLSGERRDPAILHRPEEMMA
jgi:hypothetical protein